MRFIKKIFHGENPLKKKNESLSAHLKDRMGNIGRKMSKGASDIFKMMKNHAKWGNKQLWGSREKGRHKPR